MNVGPKFTLDEIDATAADVFSMVTDHVNSVTVCIYNELLSMKLIYCYRIKDFSALIGKGDGGEESTTKISCKGRWLKKNAQRLKSLQI